MAKPKQLKIENQLEMVNCPMAKMLIPVHLRKGKDYYQISCKSFPQADSTKNDCCYLDHTTCRRVFCKYKEESK